MVPTYEITFAAGLFSLVQSELHDILGKQYRCIAELSESCVIETALPAFHLLKLRTIFAVYEKLHFAIPRPRALLGQEHFQRLSERLREIMQGHRFQSFRLDGAGNDSSVFQRLGKELERSLRIPHVPNEGELQIRLKRSGDGWGVLLRLTPRPLSARPWRVADMPGALNASIAAALMRLATTRNGFLCNIASGSGTLLIEAQEANPSLTLVGVELDPNALRQCNLNVTAAKCTATLLQANARELPLGSSSIDLVVSDLPWGERIGTRDSNVDLYHAILTESGRILKPGGEAIFLTQHIEALNQALSNSNHLREKTRLRISQKGFSPTVVLLEQLGKSQ